jgi:uncharacterized protein (UPF0303 family)
MPELPEYPVAELQREPALDVSAFTNDDAVRLGELAVAVIREHAWNLAVRVVVRGDLVFQAKLGGAGPITDPWLAGKAAVVHRFGEPSLLVKRRHQEAGTPFEERDDVDHETLKAAGGSVPIRVDGQIVGTITTSGEAEEIDHLAASEAIRRFNAS